MELNLTVNGKGKPMLIADGAKFRFVKDIKITDEKFLEMFEKKLPSKSVDNRHQ